ncbi:MAG: cupin domain-containing protein [Longimicrobiales bacterium]
MDPVSTGSPTLMMGASDLPPGDAIGVHRHLREEEIIVITRGTGRGQLGREFHTAGAGATIFIPRGTCIGLTNIGTDTLSNFFVFSTPGFERSLRGVSSAPGEPPRMLTPELRTAAFAESHAQANPPDC